MPISPIDLDAVLESLLDQFPRYDLRQEPIAYDLRLRTLSGIPFVTAADVQSMPGCAFIDNSTILDAYWLLAILKGMVRPDNINFEEPPANSAHETTFKLLTDLVVYERIVCDGFVVSNSPLVREIISHFSGIISPLCISIEDRRVLHDVVYAVYEKASRQLDSVGDLASFFDGAYIDRDLFMDWWSKYSGPRGIELRPPQVLDQYVDVAMPQFLRDSILHHYRTLYYLALSKFSGVPYSPHPCRTLLLGSALTRQRLTEERILSFFEREVIDFRNKQDQEILGDVIASVSIPPVAGLILSMVKQGASLVEAVHTVRTSRQARSFRSWCQQLSALALKGSEGTAERSAMLKELRDLCTKWKGDLDEGYKKTSRKVTFAVWSSLLRADFPDFKDPILWHKQPNVLFLNDLLRSSVWERKLRENRDRATQALRARISKSGK